MNSNRTELQLLVLYNATENEYSISAHNQTLEEAQKLLEEWNPHLKPGFRLITLVQRKAHKGTEAAACRACRDIVRERSGLQPPPTFNRRKKV
jgi:hypothetical protein